MALPKTDFIWMNGEYVKWEDATMHVLAHVVHYGTCWFEGIRAYKTAKGTAVFRLPEHTKRFFNSARIYHTEIPYSEQEISDICIEIVRKNKLEACYIRPFAYRGFGELGIFPLNCPIEVSVASWEWGTYLGKGALEDGVDVCVSSWNRLEPNSMPSLSKASGNYLNAQLIKMEAVRNGYSEAIALNSKGYISEGSGQNVFIIQEGVIYTPPLSASVLGGITRDSVMTIAKDLGYEVCEKDIPRSILYTCDEVFFTGTAAEITPVRSVDRISVGKGKVGDMTKSIQDKFFDVVHNGNDPHNWLTFV
jgi:branched-chain amino acid aminotransferase